MAEQLAEQEIPFAGTALQYARASRPASTTAREAGGVADRELPWGELPPIPERDRGSAAEGARRRGRLASVITQQLQADALAVEMAGQLLGLAPDRGKALLHDDGAGRGAARRGVVAARRRGRRDEPSATRI